MLALSVGILFAIHDVIVRGGRKRLGSREANLVSLISGIPILAFFATIMTNKASTTIDALIFYLCAGVFNFTVGRASLYIAIERVGVSVASLLNSTSIIFGILISILVVGEFISIQQIIGALMIMIAIVLSTINESGNPEGRGYIFNFIDLKGVGAGILSAFGISLAIVFGRLGNLNGGDPFIGALIAYLIGIFNELVIISRYRDGLKNIIYGTSRNELVSIGIAGAIASLGQMFRYVALVFYSAGIVVALQNIRPIVGTILTSVFSKYTRERPRLIQYLASVVAFFGVALIVL